MLALAGTLARVAGTVNNRPDDNTAYVPFVVQHSPGRRRMYLSLYPYALVLPFSTHHSPLAPASTGPEHNASRFSVPPAPHHGHDPKTLVLGRRDIVVLQ